ncbi:hypothetical protein F1737_08880 [Methanoplanus sp. FWC-SCC4]|uniref:Uncharacterized protein n=1 Tax=Methanochimaera problematica TaxID=2609417 RepID=A0AA97FEY2_9EURY|nr:hypothetical protein [Methanoplanus sp. FWC-SCC4]WOF16793.1 hypothetical protein F1737_08880 [Methanoplanus sp. FWC-SCC4]
MSNPAINKKCDLCEKKAIGMQILGCVQQTVCEEHAEKILIAMKPGESKNCGACYYVRYE